MDGWNDGGRTDGQMDEQARKNRINEQPMNEQ